MPDRERKRRLDRERIAAKRAVKRAERCRAWEELNPWMRDVPFVSDVFRDVRPAEELLAAPGRTVARG